VRPDRQGAHLVVTPTSQVSSSMILPVVAPDSLTGDKAVSVLVPRLGMSQIGHGDTVQFNVDGVLRYALVVGASSRGRVKCLLWYRADDLPEVIQFNGLSVGASFAGSDSTLELVLSTKEHLVRIKSIVSRAWACSPAQFDTAAVTGLAHVFLANLWFTGSALQRLPSSLLEGSRTEQAQVLRDRVALADAISRHLRRSSDKSRFALQLSLGWWSYFKNESSSAGFVVNSSTSTRTFLRPLLNGGDISQKVSVKLETIEIRSGFGDEFRAQSARVGGNSLSTSTSRLRIIRPLHEIDTIHRIVAITLQYCLDTATVTVKMTATKEGAAVLTTDDQQEVPLGAAPLAPAAMQAEGAGGRAATGAPNHQILIGRSFRFERALVTVLTVNDQLTSIQMLGSEPRDVPTQVIYDAYASRL